MKGYRIRLAEPDWEHREVDGLLQRNLPGLDAGVLAWKGENPSGPPDRWVAVEQDGGAVVGTTGLLPRRLWVGGTPRRAGIASDFAVDHGHRGFGPGLRLQQAMRTEAASRSYALLYGVPNRLALPVVIKSGFTLIGKYQRFIKILHAEYKPGCYMPPARITRACAPLLDRLLAWFSPECWYRRPRGWEVEHPEDFDERFDRLWERSRAGFDVVGERTARMLRWRFGQSPRPHGIFLVRRPDGELAGYAVYVREEKLVRIADVFFSDGHGLWALLAEFLRWARGGGVTSVTVSYLGRGILRRRLRSFGFLLHPGESHSVLYCATTSFPGQSSLSDPRHWHFTDFDNDAP